VHWSTRTSPGVDGPVLGDGTLSAVLDAVAGLRAVGAIATATVVLSLGTDQPSHNRPV
jgi:hypothetical protein